MLAKWRGVVFEIKRIRRGEFELYREIVDFFDINRLAGHGKLRRRGTVKLLVLDAVLDGEHHVICGEGVAVRPFCALQQMEGELRGIVVDLPFHRKVRQNLGEIHVPANQPLIADHAQDAVMVRRTAQATAQCASIGADFLVRRHHHRIFRQAFGQRRQFAVLYQRLQFRRLLAGSSPRRGPDDGKGGHAANTRHKGSARYAQ